MTRERYAFFPASVVLRLKALVRILPQLIAHPLDTKFCFAFIKSLQEKLSVFAPEHSGDIREVVVALVLDAISRSPLIVPQDYRRWNTSNLSSLLDLCFELGRPEFCATLFGRLKSCPNNVEKSSWRQAVIVAARTTDGHMKRLSNHANLPPAFSDFFAFASMTLLDDTSGFCDYMKSDILILVLGRLSGVPSLSKMYVPHP